MPVAFAGFCAGNFEAAGFDVDIDTSFCLVVLVDKCFVIVVFSLGVFKARFEGRFGIRSVIDIEEVTRFRSCRGLVLFVRRFLLL